MSNQGKQKKAEETKKQEKCKETYRKKENKAKQADGVAQVVDHLPGTVRL
jgi:hypothetical protein